MAALWLLQPMLRCVCQRQHSFNDVTIRHTYFLPVFFGPMLSSCPAWIRPQMPSFFMSALYPMSVEIKSLYNIWVFAATADSGLPPLRPPLATLRRLGLEKPRIKFLPFHLTAVPTLSPTLISWGAQRRQYFCQHLI